MGRLLRVSRALLWASLATLSGIALDARADITVDGSLDVRAVDAQGQTSFLDGGLGELRFDQRHDGLRFDSARVGVTADVGNEAQAHLEAVSYGDGDRSPVDATEAYLELRPFPHQGWRMRWKIGAFYAPISLENRLAGWRSAYTLSPSAINSWVGEELRTIGAEYSLDWLGQQRGHDWNLSLVGSGYSWNETAGTLLALRGWALQDRQTTLFGRIGAPAGGPVAGLREFYAYPGQKIGYYIGGSADYRDSVQLRVLHYDNRANPTEYAEAIDNYAWHTGFDSAGARWELTPHWTLISQWMAGSTATQPDDDYYEWRFHAAFLLANWRAGDESVSLRYDAFQMQQISPTDEFVNSNRGHAWTASFQHEFNSHFNLAFEALQIDSRLASRVWVGAAPGARERELQLAARLEF